MGFANKKLGMGRDGFCQGISSISNMLKAYFHTIPALLCTFQARLVGAINLFSPQPEMNPSAARYTQSSTGSCRKWRCCVGGVACGKA